MKKLMTLFLIVPLLASTLLFPVHSDASEMNFSVSANIPENQIDKTKSYFHLKLAPGKEQTVDVTLTNETDQELTVLTSVNTAVTNDNGIVDYSQENPKLDKTLKYPISELTESAGEVVLPANSSKNYPIKISMPNEAFDGTILGGIYFKEKTPKKKESQSKDIQIENQYAYVIGMILTQNDTQVKPDLTLNAITPTQINYRNVVTANLQNTEATILKDLDVEAQIYKGDGTKVLHEAFKQNMRMAPNSNFNFPISWGTQEFEPGKYRLDMIATSGEKFWKWSEYFTIDGKTADDLNETALDIEKDYTWLYIIGGSILALLILLLVFLLGRRSRKDEEEE
ncbi:cell surface protein [Listeria newyorkensis]|uniref:Cell surface protein n=1 Tax=Listeria newyorkensis TaxID=1497681 RepID=A0ABX4XN43_9LIST|nr:MULTISPECIES: DUF916 and DUF3324 domain-containing protein [Listeria]KGL42361.1 cell surface protein [Listeriaceae bacterium FSL A5-0209]KGL38793.1 cell surface protein [Listeria newyorkensis]PNP92763.1 cell surface protein [Listeria newyorkensis]RQW66564.1 DUF916 and DUF3324 domain-containing protein [Listeria sp. SHR_NRA_18]WAO23042.1 DUF916 and DUF3324 domain-containing protein [Listeria newyorkensis]